MNKNCFLLLFSFVPFFLFSQVYFYETTSESEEIIPSRWTIEENASGFVLYLENEEGSQRIVCRDDGDVVSMEEWNLSSDKIFEFKTNGEFINVSVVNDKNKLKSATLKRDPQIPIYQPMGLSMQSFILGDLSEQVFYVIDENALKLRKMVVKKQGVITLDLMDQKRTLIKTEIRLTGILNKLWSGKCYFLPDGRWAYFEGKVTLTSSPVKIKLVKIKNR